MAASNVSNVSGTNSDTRIVRYTLLGVLLGATIASFTTLYVNNLQLKHGRATRSFDMRLETYSDFDNHSLLIMDDFITRGSTNDVRAQRFNELFSTIGLISSEKVRLAAADVHLVIARLKVADDTQVADILKADALSLARVKFRKAVQAELELTK